MVVAGKQASDAPKEALFALHRQLGITLDHYAAWQYLEGTRVVDEWSAPRDPRLPNAGRATLAGL